MADQNINAVIDATINMKGVAESVSSLIKRIREEAKEPIVVGFEVDTGDFAKEVKYDLQDIERRVLEMKGRIEKAADEIRRMQSAGVSRIKGVAGLAEDDVKRVIEAFREGRSSLAKEIDRLKASAPDGGAAPTAGSEARRRASALRTLKPNLEKTVENESRAGEVTDEITRRMEGEAAAFGQDMVQLVKARLAAKAKRDRILREAEREATDRGVVTGSSRTDWDTDLSGGGKRVKGKGGNFEVKEGPFVTDYERQQDMKEAQAEAQKEIDAIESRLVNIIGKHGAAAKDMLGFLDGVLSHVVEVDRHPVNEQLKTWANRLSKIQQRIKLAEREVARAQKMGPEAAAWTQEQVLPKLARDQNLAARLKERINLVTGFAAPLRDGSGGQARESLGQLSSVMSSLTGGTNDFRESLERLEGELMQSLQAMGAIFGSIDGKQLDVIKNAVFNQARALESGSSGVGPSLRDAKEDIEHLAAVMSKIGADTIRGPALGQVDFDLSQMTKQLTHIREAIDVLKKTRINIPVTFDYARSLSAFRRRLQELRGLRGLGIDTKVSSTLDAGAVQSIIALLNEQLGDQEFVARVRPHETFFITAMTELARKEDRLPRLRIKPSEPFFISAMEAVLRKFETTGANVLRIKIDPIFPTAQEMADNPAAAMFVGNSRSATGSGGRARGSAADNRSMVIAGRDLPTLEEFMRAGERVREEQVLVPTTPRKVGDDEVLARAAFNESSWINNYRKGAVEEEAVRRRASELRKEFMDLHFPRAEYVPQRGLGSRQNAINERNFRKREEAERVKKFAEGSYRPDFEAQARTELEGRVKIKDADRPDFIHLARAELEKFAKDLAIPKLETRRTVEQTRSAEEHRKQVEESLAKGIIPKNIESVLSAYPDLFEKYRKPLESALRRKAQAEAKAADKAEARASSGGTVGTSYAERTRESKDDRLRRRRARQAEEEALRTEIRGDPVPFIRSLGNQRMNEIADVVLQAKKSGNVDEIRRATSLLAEFGREMNASKEALTNSDSLNALTHATRAFKTHYFSPLNAIVQRENVKDESAAIRDAEAEKMRREYLDGSVGRFMSSISGSSGFDRYVDYWKDADKSRTHYYSKVKKYEDDVLAIAYAKNRQEQDIALTKVEGARKEAELSREFMRVRMLMDKGSTTMPALGHEVRMNDKGEYESFATLLRDEDGAPKTQKTSKFEAYRLMSSLNQQEVGPAYELYREDLNKQRSTVLDAARAAMERNDLAGRDAEMAKLADLGGMDMHHFTEAIIRGEQAATDLLKATMKLTAEEKELVEEARKYGREEEEVNNILTQRIAILAEVRKGMKALIDETERERRSMDLLQKYERLSTVRDQQGDPFRQAASRLSYMFGMAGGSFVVGMEFTRAFRELAEFEQEMTQIKGVLRGSSDSEIGALKKEIGSTAVKYGANLIETAQAAKLLAQTGMDASEVIKELNATMIGSRGMGVAIDKVQEFQITIRELSKLREQEGKSTIDSMDALNRVSTIEAEYAVTAEDLMTAVQALSPVLQQFEGEINGLADSMDYTMGITTAMVEQLRITGSQASNATKMIFSRLVRPELLKSLQEDFGVKVANEQGTDFLALNEILGQVVLRYQQLKKESPAAAKALAVQLSGGRQVAATISMLEHFDKVQEVATKSSFAFTGAQERANLTLNTLTNSLTRVRNSFTLFTDNLMNSTEAASGLKGMLNGISDLLNGMSHGGGSGLVTTLMAIFGTGLAVQGGRKALNYVSVASLMGADTAAVVAAQKMQKRSAMKALVAETGAVGGAGILGRMSAGMGAGSALVGSTAMVAGSVVAVVGALGLIIHHFKKAKEASEKYKAAAKTLDLGEIYNSPQMEEYREISRKLGLGTTAEANSMIDGLVFEGHSKVLYEDGTASSFTVPMQNLFAKYGGVTDGAEVKELAKFLNDSPQLLNGFRREFVENFINGLPVEAKHRFAELRTEEEKVAMAVKLIGSSAWAANVQIANSIDAISKSTTQMVADSLRNIDALDKRTARSVWYRRAIVGIQETFGREFADTEVYMGDTLAPHLADERIQRKFVDYKQSQFKDMPQVATAMLSGRGKQVLEQVIREMRESGVKNTTMAEIDSRFLSRMQHTPVQVRNPDGSLTQTPLSEVQQRAISAAMLGQTDALRALSAVDPDLVMALTENPDYVTSARSYNAEYLNAASDYSIQRVEDEADKLFGNQRDLLQLYEVLSDPRAGQGFVFNLNEASGALNKFKNSLLDMVLNIYQNIERSKVEREMSDRFGFAYNEGDAKVQLGKQIYQDVRMFPAVSTIEILKMLTDVDRSNEVRSMLGNADARTRLGMLQGEMGEGDATTGGSEAQKNIRRLLAQVSVARTEFSNVTGSEFNLDDLLGDSQEAQRVISSIQGMLQEAQGDVKAGLLAMLLELGRALIDQGQKLNSERARTLMLYDLERSSAEKSLEYTKAKNELERDVVAKFQSEHKLRYDMLQQELTRLEYQKSIRAEDQAALTLQQDRLKAEFLVNEAHLARMEYVKAENDLMEQARTNIQGSLTGIGNTLKDLNVWNDILNAEDARARAEAVRRVIQDTLAPIGQTIHDRMVDNLMETVGEAVEGNEMLAKMFRSPEVRMRDTMRQASDLMREGIANSSELGATTFNTQIIAASVEGASKFYQAITAAVSGMPNPTLPQPTAPATPAASESTMDGTVLDPIVVTKEYPGVMNKGGFGKANRWLDGNPTAAGLISSGVGIIGAHAGTAVGGGSQMASTGSSLGGMVGMTLGSAGGPLGSMVGGMVGNLVGGALGGWLGGGKDTESTQVYAHLDAIERATRETVTAIERQTDALISPENRLLNLPSTFNIPGYMPGFGGGGGGGGSTSVTYEITEANQITVAPVINKDMDEEEITRVVKRAVSDALSEGRHNGGSRVRKW
jgi:hypothetical protein